MHVKLGDLVVNEAMFAGRPRDCQLFKLCSALQRNYSNKTGNTFPLGATTRGVWVIDA